MAVKDKEKSETVVEEGQLPSAVEVLAEEAGLADDEKVSTKPTIKIRDRVFELRREIPPIALMRLASASDDRTSDSKKMAAISGFLDLVVAPSNRAEFYDFLAEAEPVFEFDEIGEILNRTIEAVSNHPT